MRRLRGWTWGKGELEFEEGGCMGLVVGSPLLFAGILDLLNEISQGNEYTVIECEFTCETSEV
jgi:hypothetical protein